MDEEIPYTKTGPAILNRFAPTPVTYPSFLNSMDTSQNNPIAVSIHTEKILMP